MDRESIAREIAVRFNNGEGTITDLSKEYEGYSRHKFYRDIESIGIVKNKEGKYIIPDSNIKGQINLLEQVAPEMQQDIKNKDAIVTEPPEKKKKTFEIDVELEKYIKVQAALENTTINEWVNKTLWEAIPEDTKEFIGD